MTRRKVVILSGIQVFPPQSGGQMRTAAIARGFARDFDTLVYSMTGRKADYLSWKSSSVGEIQPHLKESVNRSFSNGWKQFFAYRRGLPPLWLTDRLRAATPMPLTKALEEADAVVVDFPFLYPAVEQLASKLVILNTHNVEADCWRDKSAELADHVESIEVAAAKASRIVVGCSEDDLRWFRAREPDKEFMLIPNGIDVSRFAPNATTRATIRRQLNISEDERLLLYCGSRYAPNKRGLTRLRQLFEAQKTDWERHKLTFLVVGSVSDHPRQEAGWIETGFVDEVEPYYAASDFAVNPVLDGSGTAVKMGEYIAARLPTLTSTFGSRGLEIGDDAVFFKSDADMGQQLEHLLSLDPDTRHQMVERLHQRNLKFIDATECVRPLVERVNEILA